MENTVYFLRTETTDLHAAGCVLLEYALGFVPEIERGPHGKPYLKGRTDLYFNLSHTHGAAVCAVSSHPVGVDVERPRRLHAGLAARFFTDSEQAYAKDEIRMIEVWTRKEALLKRSGEGISVPLEQAETMEHPLISTSRIGEFTFSFCGDPPEFRLIELPEQKILQRILPK